MLKQLQQLRTLLLALLVMAGAGNVWGQTTVTQTTFSSSSGNVNNDTNVSYTSYKGGGTTAPAANSNAIRLYQNSSGATGGYIVIGVKEGYVITSATIKSTMATTTGYKLTETSPGNTTPAKNTFAVSDYSLSANTDYTVDNISTRYITFACFGSSSSSRLYLSKISITYQTENTSAVQTTTTIDASGITNTDVYTGTEAGLLSATVTAGGSSVEGASVTWTSSTPSVATINSNGEVTLVAPGTTKITASYYCNNTIARSSCLDWVAIPHLIKNSPVIDSIQSLNGCSSSIRKGCSSGKKKNTSA